MRPTALFPPTTPFTDHVTLRSTDPVTVAVNCCTFPAPSVAVFGETVTVMLEFGPTTCTLNGAEVEPPGSGLTTVTGAVPTCASVGVPTAINCVGAIKVVLNCTVPRFTMDPAVKPVPFTVISDCTFAVRIVGVTLLMTGIGFSSVTVALPDFVGSSTLVAVTVTVLGVGKVRGPVYAPFAAIVPVVALPPATPLTVHVTLR